MSLLTTYLISILNILIFKLNTNIKILYIKLLYYILNYCIIY
uniref:Uncharacterized protein n=1 Tax=viral metagenome TaxID=1070528 RepID=A0A6C0CDV0_9ZZZZ